MFKTARILLSMIILGTCAASIVHAETGWIQIDASEPFTDRNGVQRAPSCSGGPVLTMTPAGLVPVPADTDFSFFFREGDPDKLAVLWDGGGACWDAITCVGSALLGVPLYDQTVDETPEELDATGGLGDSLNSANPIRDYTQIFIPYCSADLHTGAKDFTYFYTAPGAGTVIPWTIHHRGYDNVVAVLEWLTNYYQVEVGRAPSDVFLAGASAGGYGVLYGYPAVAGLLPQGTKTRVLIDAANGVINQDFFDRALTPNGVWGVWDNLSPELTQAFSSGPDELAIEIFKGLASSHPRTRFGQYTTAFDSTQIQFYIVALILKSPELWFDPLQIALAGLEWSLRARLYMQSTAKQVINYRFYLGQGTDHTVIADNKFYTENSARSVYFSDWVDDMINRRWPRRSAWRNLSCSPDCLPP